MRAFITGVAGPALTHEERQFLREARPWGLIVFLRNIAGPDPLRRLIGEYHKYLAAQFGLTASPIVVAAWGAGPVR